MTWGKTAREKKKLIRRVIKFGVNNWEHLYDGYKHYTGLPQTDWRQGGMRGIFLSDKCIMIFFGTGK